MAALPRDLAGKWVLVLVSGDNQQVIASGDNPHEVTRGRRVDNPDLLLTQVPRECSVSIVSHGA
jgi:hypothetical protein